VSRHWQRGCGDLSEGRPGLQCPHGARLSLSGMPAVPLEKSTEERTKHHLAVASEVKSLRNGPVSTKAGGGGGGGPG